MRTKNTSASAPIEERLLFHITKMPSGCWEWTTNIGSNRTASLRISGQLMKTNRLAYETWVGPIPEGMVVRHKCDNPPCINPEHLELGTMKDNSQDMVQRGRSPRGEHHGMSKLTKEGVHHIRELLLRGLTHEKIATEMNVTRETISSIHQKKSWGWLA